MRHRFIVVTALAAALAATWVGAAPALAGAAAPAASPNASAVVRAMAAAGIDFTHRRDESPTVTVSDGLCSLVRAGGCRVGWITKDATLLVFGTAAQASLYAGNADDRATALGRTVVSFGSPARMGEPRQHRYLRAVRAYRATHANKNEVRRVAQYLMRHGLPMRDAHRDAGIDRQGLAAGIPGAVSMVATTQADVIVFSGTTAASAYTGNADDQTYRRGRVVLSFGNPALLDATRQSAYAAGLRQALR